MGGGTGKKEAGEQSVPLPLYSSPWRTFLPRPILGLGSYHALFLLV